MSPPLEFSTPRQKPMLQKNCISDEVRGETENLWTTPEAAPTNSMSSSAAPDQDMTIPSLTRRPHSDFSELLEAANRRAEKAPLLPDFPSMDDGGCGRLLHPRSMPSLSPVSDKGQRRCPCTKLSMRASENNELPMLTHSVGFSISPPTATVTPFSRRAASSRESEENSDQLFLNIDSSVPTLDNDEDDDDDASSRTPKIKMWGGTKTFQNHPFSAFTCRHD